MSLLREIQDALMREDSQLGPVLLKLRFLASRLGSNVLEDWVKHESEGYPEAVELPDYRLIGVSYRGTFFGPFNASISNAPIPPYLIEKYAGKRRLKFHLRQSIAAIDALVSSESSSSTLTFDAGNLALLLQGNIYEDYACNSVIGTISRADFIEVQYSVRTRILELTLQLEKEVPAASEIATGPAQNGGKLVDPEEVSQIFHQTIYGNVTTINSTGDAAKIQVSIAKGDINGLVRALVDGGISESDASELAEIVSSEAPGSKEEPFGKRAKEWFAKNIVKAANGTWNVGIAVATKVVTEATLKYYGLK